MGREGLYVIQRQGRGEEKETDRYIDNYYYWGPYLHVVLLKLSFWRTLLTTITFITTVIKETPKLNLILDRYIDDRDRDRDRDRERERESEGDIVVPQA